MNYSIFFLIGLALVLSVVLIVSNADQIKSEETEGIISTDCVYRNKRALDPASRRTRSRKSIRVDSNSNDANSLVRSKRSSSVFPLSGGLCRIGTETPTQPPVTQPPVTQPPVTQPPVTQPPVTQPPVTQPPVTQPPVTQPPVTQPPVTQPPVAQPPAEITGTPGLLATAPTIPEKFVPRTPPPFVFPPFIPSIGPPIVFPPVFPQPPNVPLIEPNIPPLGPDLPPFDPTDPIFPPSNPIPSQPLNPNSPNFPPYDEENPGFPPFDGSNPNFPILDPNNDYPPIFPPFISNNPLFPIIGPNGPVFPSLNPNQPVFPQIDPDNPSFLPYNPNSPLFPNFDPNNPEVPTFDPNDPFAPLLGGNLFFPQFNYPQVYPPELPTFDPNNPSLTPIDSQNPFLPVLNPNAPFLPPLDGNPFFGDSFDGLPPSDQPSLFPPFGPNSPASPPLDPNNPIFSPYDPQNPLISPLQEGNPFQPPFNGIPSFPPFGLPPDYLPIDPFNPFLPFDPQNPFLPYLDPNNPFISPLQGGNPFQPPFNANPSFPPFGLPPDYLPIDPLNPFLPYDPQNPFLPFDPQNPFLPYLDPNNPFISPFFPPYGESPFFPPFNGETLYPPFDPNNPFLPYPPYPNPYFPSFNGSQVYPPFDPNNPFLPYPIYPNPYLPPFTGPNQPTLIPGAPCGTFGATLSNLLYTLATTISPSNFSGLGQAVSSLLYGFATLLYGLGQTRSDVPRSSNEETISLIQAIVTQFDEQLSAIAQEATSSGISFDQQAKDLVIQIQSNERSESGLENKEQVLEAIIGLEMLREERLSSQSQLQFSLGLDCVGLIDSILNMSVFILNTLLGLDPSGDFQGAINNGLETPALSPILNGLISNGLFENIGSVNPAISLNKLLLSLIGGVMDLVNSGECDLCQSLGGVLSQLVYDLVDALTKLDPVLRGACKQIIQILNEVGDKLAAKGLRSSGEEADNPGEEDVTSLSNSIKPAIEAFKENLNYLEGDGLKLNSFMNEIAAELRAHPEEMEQLEAALDAIERITELEMFEPNVKCCQTLNAFSKLLIFLVNALRGTLFDLLSLNKPIG